MVVGEDYKRQEKYEGFLKEQLDAETICDKTAMLLRGYRWDPNEGKFTNVTKITVFNEEKGVYEEVEFITKPLLNELGIQAVVSELRSRIANVFGSGSLTGNQIKSIRHVVAEVLWKKLRHNRKLYNLSLDDFESVLQIVDDQLTLFLSRTEKGGFLRTISRMIGRKENVNLSVNEETKNKLTKKGGLFE